MKHIPLDSVFSVDQLPKQHKRAFIALGFANYARLKARGARPMNWSPYYLVERNPIHGLEREQESLQQTVLPVQQEEISEVAKGMGQEEQGAPQEDSPGLLPPEV